MENSWMGKSIGIFEFDNMVACLVAMDAAAKAADIAIQGVERNRLKAGACVKIRGCVFPSTSCSRKPPVMVQVSA